MGKTPRLMPRTIPQKNAPGQTTRCQSVRGANSLAGRSHLPETVASTRTAKESAWMRLDKGASASFVADLIEIGVSRLLNPHKLLI